MAKTNQVSRPVLILFPKFIIQSQKNPVIMNQVDFLNAVQEREFNRDTKVEAFLIQQKKEYEDNAPFNRVVQLLLGNIAKVNPVTPQKGKKGKIVTNRKNTLKASIAADVNIICTSAKEYALATSDEDLLNNVRFSASDIKDAKDGNVDAIVTTITDALTPLLDIPAFKEYNVTADMLTTLTQTTKDFNDILGKAAVIDIGSSLANGQLNSIFKSIRSNIASLRRLLPNMEKDHPEFVKGFNSAAMVDFSGIRHSGIEGIITNALSGAPVKDVVVTGEGKKKEVKTDSKGYYKLVRLKVTDMKITITATGFDTQVISVKIIRNKILPLNIGLRGKVISLSTTA